MRAAGNRGDAVPYLTAHVLDRLNERVVRWRLHGRLPPPSGEPLQDYLGALGERVHPSPDGLAPLEPEPGGPAGWHAPSPWPEAVGRNGRWHAEMRPPRGHAAPPGGRAPALILLHGWLIDRPQLPVYRRWARRVARHGIAVWMPRLPYHMERSEPGEISGQRCLSPDLRDSADAVRQAVAEARLLARWLRRNGAPAVGIWGMSLGAWVAALAATLDDDWDAVALWAPVAAPADVLFESGLVGLLREVVTAGGTSRRDLEDSAVAAMTPSLRDNRVARERLMVVAGIWDQVIAPRSITRLARRWNVDVRWVPHGHISLMASRAPVRATAAFFGQTLGQP